MYPLSTGGVQADIHDGHKLMGPSHHRQSPIPINDNFKDKTESTPRLQPSTDKTATRFTTIARPYPTTAIGSNAVMDATSRVLRFVSHRERLAAPSCCCS